MISAEGLNESAKSVFVGAADRARELNIQVSTLECGAHVIDFGVHTVGGLNAGVQLAAICLAGKAEIRIAIGDRAIWPGPWVQVATDHPVEACMFGQYAGWPVKNGNFFAMGSGPMRVRRAKEELLLSLAATDSQDTAVGSLECDLLPDCEVALGIAAECDVSANNLWLAVAPTRSMAGGVQVVARSVETALHKLHELGFPLSAVKSAYGLAPLPPPTPDFSQAIGRTNDAVLYGGHVTLWLDAEDDQISEVGAKLPSSHSSDFGLPFAEIFEKNEFDFYKIDPGLFSPAEVVLENLRSGRSWRFGCPQSELIAKSFSTEVAG